MILIIDDTGDRKKGNKTDYVKRLLHWEFRESREWNFRSDSLRGNRRHHGSQND